MKPEEYNQRLEMTIAKIIDDYHFIRCMMGKCGSAEVFVHDLAAIALDHWNSGKHHGKPPWIRGRMKTRGGRDQDRWRKRHSTVKIMRERRNLLYRSMEDYCRANGIEFRRFDCGSH